MHDIIVNFINQFGYLAVFLLITIENVFPPIPSEVILTYAGFMTISAVIHPWGVIFAATAGSVVGAIILYFIGKILNTDRLERLLDSKLGRILRLKKGDVRMAESWFLKRGNMAVFFCRFIPIVRSLISIPAGVSRMNFSVFLLLTTIGTLIWNVVLVYLGRSAGSAWEKVSHYFDTYSLIAAVVLVAIAGIVALLFIKKRFLSGRDE